MSNERRAVTLKECCDAVLSNSNGKPIMLSDLAAIGGEVQSTYLCADAFSDRNGQVGSRYLTDAELLAEAVKAVCDRNRIMCVQCGKVNDTNQEWWATADGECFCLECSDSNQAKPAVTLKECRVALLAALEEATGCEILQDLTAEVTELWEEIEKGHWDFDEGVETVCAEILAARSVEVGGFLYPDDEDEDDAAMEQSTDQIEGRSIRIMDESHHAEEKETE